MSTFSHRNGYIKIDLKLEYVSEKLKNSIFGLFYAKEFIPNFFGITLIEKMSIIMGIDYSFPLTEFVKSNNAYYLKKFLMSQPWYIFFDFIEKYLSLIDSDKKNEDIVKEFNKLFENDCSAYRIVNRIVVPITNESEISAINSAINTEFDSVNIHISKSIALYANKKSPDYENSIKESISAVESMCCIIANKKTTLGDALKKLESKGIIIHHSLINAFNSLYGFTSDQGGIRHGSIEFKNASMEDAKFMLVSCSAFINYLIEKLNKKV